MKQYLFTIEEKIICYGAVTANSKEEAIEKIKNEDYDDIYDSSSLDFDFDTIEIKEGED